MLERKVRQPIISVMGHVDHGKTLILDKIRGTTVTAREAGAITQHIGATEVPTHTIEKICGDLLKKFDIGVDIPGLLFIDTPGHEAFANLRRRGGALADLAVLVVDATEGIKPQTKESIGLLKSNKTPFIVAANKIDKIVGWQAIENSCFLESIKTQSEKIQRKVDEHIYELVGKLHEAGLESERFDRVGNFRKQVAIVPTSAKTGEGIPELLSILAGLAQRFMEKELTVKVTGPGRGTVLEVKEDVGLGTTIDAIIYDGTLEKKDMIAVGGLEDVIVSKVRALLQPKPLDEIRDPEDKFRHVQRVVAAAGVKISAPNLEGVVAGAPLWKIESESEANTLREQLREELNRVRISSKIDGVIVKTDALGSLEALENQLKLHNIPIRKADIGDVSRRDVIEATAVAERDPISAVILAFNVDVSPDAKKEAESVGINIIEEQIIYRLIETYEEWAEEKREEVRREKLKDYMRPGKCALKPGFVFRRSNPAIVGVDVLGGVLKPRFQLIDKNGKKVGVIKEIQKEQKTVSEAKIGDELALSIEGAVIGRHIDEGDVLYVDIPREQVMTLKRDLRDMLSGDELGVLDEIIEIKKKKDATYGVM